MRHILYTTHQHQRCHWHIHPLIDQHGQNSGHKESDNGPLEEFDHQAYNYHVRTYGKTKYFGNPIISRYLPKYDEINLFKPQEIDLFSGYRYYSNNQLDDLKLILSLKDVGFSLEEIKKNKNNYSDALFLKKKEELLKEQKNLDNKIKKLDYLRSRIKNNHIILNAPVKKEIKKLERLR